MRRSMMSYFFVIVMSLGPSAGEISTRYVAVNPDHPDMCYDEHMGGYRRLGEKWQLPNICIGYSCDVAQQYRGLYMEIKQKVCARIAHTPRGCRMSTEVANIPYPNCCPKLRCPGVAVINISLAG